MENNTAPFEVGDEVVCVDNTNYTISSHIIPLKKGNTYPVLRIRQCLCGLWKIDVGIMVAPTSLSSACACRRLAPDRRWWFNATRFKKTNPYSQSLSQELAQQALKETIEIDVPLKVLQS